VSPNGSIKISFTDINIPRANQVNPWLLPIAKPIDLAIATGKLYLT
jgi:hypothetical protein